jgi:hypothetical protein
VLTNVKPVKAASRRPNFNTGNYSCRMCKLYYRSCCAFLIGIFAPGFCQGQPALKTQKVNPNYFFGFVVNAGILNALNKPADLTISFPYTRISGSASQQQAFSQTIKHALPTNLMMMDVLHVTFGGRRFTGDLGFGGLLNWGTAGKGFNGSEGYMLTAGIGKLFAFSVKKGKRHLFLLKPSLNFSFTQFSIDFNKIDNQQCEIDAFNFKATASYTYSTSKGTLYETAYARDLGFFLKENALNLYPKLSIITNPFKNRFYFGLETAYYISIGKKELLKFYQESSSQNGWRSMGTVNVSNNDLSLQYGDRTGGLPACLRKFYFGISIGVAFGSGDIRK